ncbi:GIY-YIG nuclease family protein [Microbacterium wangruii]|uniref:GIY-YIG nuclease family protein n=1 Tax=Microbacterium wangruii TaxID=3049073 RepID=UPI00256EF4B0|nr:GIY-YIG nuclease family protein [Microbacterium sp. zg-Y1211]MDL5486021.1 GIY-YIG nuclease family protein [Microbacterium sp. zg-Y1211]
MSSRGSARPGLRPRKPPRNTLPADDVRRFRASLSEFLEVRDEHGRKWADATWGVYAFYDYDGEPIYVGQTNERLRTRVRRHLTNQRTDAVAMRILDVFEVASVQIFPLWDLEGTASSNKDARHLLDAVEYSAYLTAIEQSRFHAILNEKIPPISPRVELPPSLHCDLIDEETRAERGHPDVRIARRAETVSRLAAVARERGEVSDGLRRVLVIQAVRLAFLSASRLAEVEGRPLPEPEASFNINELVGSVLYEHDGGTSTEEDIAD